MGKAKTGVTGNGGNVKPHSNMKKPSSRPPKQNTEGKQPPKQNKEVPVLEEKRWKFQLEPAGSGKNWQDVPQFLWKRLSKFCEEGAPRTINLPTSFIMEREGRHPRFDLLGQKSCKVWSVLENHADTPNRTVILQLVDVKLRRFLLYLHLRWFLDSDVALWEAKSFRNAVSMDPLVDPPKTPKKTPSLGYTSPGAAGKDCDRRDGPSLGHTSPGAAGKDYDRDADVLTLKGRFAMLLRTDREMMQVEATHAVIKFGPSAPESGSAASAASFSRT